MKIMYRCIFFILTFFIITNVYAGECTKEELKELNTLAEQINFSYKFDDTQKMFNIYVYNLNEKIKIVDGYINYVYDSNRKEPTNTKLYKNYISGQKVSFEIYATNKTKCADQKIFTKQIQLPEYNYYYENELCKDILEYKLCKKWQDTSDINEQQFKKLINEYKNSKNENEKTNIFSLIFEYIIEYWYVLVGLIVIVIIVILTKMYKRSKRIKIKI